MFFGKAQDYPDCPAKTILAVMVKCLFTRRRFIAKLIPCAALTSSFQYGIVSTLISDLEASGATVLAIVNDNNKVNQSYFELFPGYTQYTPYVCYPFIESKRPLFLLYDTVHIMENIRNNWLTEPTQVLKFPIMADGGLIWENAHWSSLRELCAAESERNFTLSGLTAAAINPNNLEKQKVIILVFR